MAASKPLHAFSVDVEDWYQSSYDFNAPISPVCIQNTHKILNFLSLHNVRGTFFVQGMVAKAFPGLIKEIQQKGHEIQSHGFSHLPVNKMNSKQFFKELRETSERLEDITGEPVTGYRAPDFSIDKGSWWAFEVMIEAGISYDSSIFPMKTMRYGVSGFDRGYSLINTPSGIIEELTVSVDELKSVIRIPIGGGGYIRLFPGWLLNYSLRKFNDQNRPFVIYCHPYEFNPKEWDQILKYVSGLRKLHQGIGRKKFPQKISSLFNTCLFGTMLDALCNCREKREE